MEGLTGEISLLYHSILSWPNVLITIFTVGLAILTYAGGIYVSLLIDCPDVMRSI